MDSGPPPPLPPFLPPPPPKLSGGPTRRLASLPLSPNLRSVALPNAAYLMNGVIVIAGNE